ncbi:MAG TPA: SUMF1/EgtB/PvdO family nonheme iron enzyme [Gemmataceae bacterium]|nr:SUMF1/EgtB/PvdO family nonheme iron enzyme [Gemmataceae bacterium]
MVRFSAPVRRNQRTLHPNLEPKEYDLGPFEIGSKEVTVQEYQEFSREFGPAHTQPLSAADVPVVSVSAVNAERYCNWRSAQDKLPPAEWAYEPSDPTHRTEALSLKPNFRTLRGYRLPTDAEWEFAVESTPRNKRLFARTALSKAAFTEYSWHRENGEARPRRVGEKKPSRLGLFDGHGNVSERCADRYVVVHQAGRSPVQMYHGLSFMYSIGDLLTFPSGRDARTVGYDSTGFRIARSLPEPAAE